VNLAIAILFAFAHRQCTRTEPLRRVANSENQNVDTLLFPEILQN